MTKCIVPKCSGIGTHHFPKDAKRRLLWQKAVRLTKLPRKPKICNKHFLDKDYGKISNYTGLIHQINYLNKNAVPSVFPWSKNIDTESSEDEDEKLQPETAKKSEKTVFPFKCVTEPVKKCKTITCDDKVFLEIPIDDIDSLQKNNNSKRTIATQTCYQLGLFSTELLLEDREAVHYYTGLQNVADFTLIFKSISPTAHIMQHCLWKNFHLSLEDQFLIVLMKLRRNKTEFELSKMFCVSKTGVCDTIVSWINFISSVWSLKDNWPSPELINLYMPEKYKKYCYQNKINNGEKECSKLLKNFTSEGRVEINENIERLLVSKGINVSNFKVKSPITISKIKLIKNNVSEENLLPILQVKSNMCLTTKKNHLKHQKEMAQRYLILNNDLDDLYAPLAAKIVCLCYMLYNFKGNKNDKDF